MKKIIKAIKNGIEVISGISVCLMMLTTAFIFGSVGCPVNFSISVGKKD